MRGNKKKVGGVKGVFFLGEGKIAKGGGGGRRGTKEGFKKRREGKIDSCTLTAQSIIIIHIYSYINTIDTFAMH